MTDIPFDICDPSYSVNASYWQLGVASRNTELWDEIKKCINKALPQKRVEEFDRTIFHERELEFWGCIKHKKSFWLYRHFLTGRDGAGRPGRYFFVIFKIEGSLEEALGFASKVCRRLADKVSIPLDLSDLKNDGESDLPKINLPDGIREKLELSSADIHIAWVIEKDKGVTEYKDLSVPKPPPPPAPIDISKDDDAPRGGENQHPNNYIGIRNPCSASQNGSNFDNVSRGSVSTFVKVLNNIESTIRIPKKTIVIVSTIVVVSIAVFSLWGKPKDEVVGSNEKSKKNETSKEKDPKKDNVSTQNSSLNTKDGDSTKQGSEASKENSPLETEGSDNANKDGEK